MLNCSAGLSSTTSSRLRRGVGVFLDAGQRRLQPLRRRRLGDEGERAARQAVMPVFIQRQHLHRDVPRGRVLLQMVKHRPAQHVGQEHVERHGRGMELAGQSERFRATHGHQHLEPLVAGQIDTARGRSADRLQRSARPHRRAADCRGRPRCCSMGSSSCDRRQLARQECSRCASVTRRRGRRRAHIGLRQIERESAALCRACCATGFRRPAGWPVRG